MKIMGIDTSSSLGGIALMEDNLLIANSKENLSMSHSARLFPLLISTLNDHHWNVRDIDLMGVTTGPGSFTGLRIGLLASKTLAQVGSIKLVGVSTLETLAWDIRKENPLVCPIMDALHGDVYCGLYACKDNNLVNIMPDSIMSLNDLIHSLKTNIDKPVCITGPGVEKHKQYIEDNLQNNIYFPLADKLTVSPIAVAELAYHKFRYDHIMQNPLTLKPAYLRKPEAEIVWEKKQINPPSIPPK